MAEYIEREAARRDEFCVGVSCQECPFLKDPINGGCRVDDFIMFIPAADVQPVKHGRWENGVTFHKVCSECNCIIVDPAFDEVFFGCGRLNYCPNCGAKMDGEI